MYQIQNDHQASIKNSLKLIELDPNFAAAYVSLGLSYLKLGRGSEAIANMEKGVDLSNRSGNTLSDLGYGYAVTGKRTEAIAIVKELEERYARKESSERQVAGVYAGLGEKDKAFGWLEKGFQIKEDIVLIKWYPVYEPLRDDPRYAGLLKRMGLPE